MRLNYMPGVIVGALLLYLGIFGIAGFGLSWSSTALPMTEDWNNFDSLQWQTYMAGNGQRPVISPAGQCYFVAGSPASADDRSAATSSIPGNAVLSVSTWTMSVLMSIDNFGSVTAPYIGTFGVAFYDSSFWFYLDVRGDGVVRTCNGVEWSWQKDSNFHTWTFLVTRSGSQGAYTASIDVYMDTGKLGTMTALPMGPYNPGTWDRLSLDCWHEMAVHVDKIEVKSGLINPGTPTTGVLIVSATKDGTSLQGVVVTISGPTGKQGTTDSSGSYTFTALSPGSYSISGSYGGQTKTDSKTVQAGATAQSTLDFTTTNPGTGVITVYAHDVYGNPVDVSVTITGPSTQSKNTGTTGAVFNNLIYGSYTISATWADETKTDSKTVTSSSPTASSTLQFSSQIQPPTQWDQILKAIRTAIDNIRTPLQIFGGLVTTVCSIMLILPAKAAATARPPA